MSPLIYLLPCGLWPFTNTNVSPLQRQMLESGAHRTTGPSTNTEGGDSNIYINIKR